MILALDNEAAQNLFLYRKRRFEQSLVKYLYNYIKIKDINKLLVLEYKNFKNSNTEVEEIRCCDRVIATVYSTRTEFNHQEVVWSVFADVFPFIKRSVITLSKRF